MIDCEKKLNILMQKSTKKAYLNFNEKRLLKYYSVFLYVIKNGGKIDIEKKIRLRNFYNYINFLKCKKKIKSAVICTDFSQLKKQYINIFLSDNLSAIIKTNENCICFFDNKIETKSYKLEINNTGIFSNSLVINKPNKTLIYNKNFNVKILICGKKLLIKSSKKIDFFDDKNIAFPLTKKVIFVPTNKALWQANLLYSQICAENKNVLKMARNALKYINGFNLIYEIANQNDYCDYLNLNFLSKILPFFPSEIKILPYFLFKHNFSLKSENCGIKFNSFLKKNLNLKTMNYSTFYYRNSFFLSGKGAFKFSLPFGIYKILKTEKKCEIKCLTSKFTFFIFGEVRQIFIESCCLNVVADSDIFLSLYKNFEEIKSEYFDKLKSNFSLNSINYQLSKKPVFTLFEQSKSFFNMEEYSPEIFESLKSLIKTKHALKLAAKKLLEFCGSVKTEKEKLKLYKISALLCRLPEKTITISSLLKKDEITSLDVKDFSIIELSELHREIVLQSQTNVLDFKYERRDESI